ncbi:hypothetical protein L1049_006001 [Liquidambar formosana]|uniref:Uncharacterized protein n=1 Tax=Liquidambar formosana TaxID=63359 RepID=A0AAP0RG53_LIQFO
MGAQDVMNYVGVKLKELLLILENFGGYLIDELDKVFPPETRGDKLRHWLRVSAPFVIAAAALLALFLCCRCCCCKGRTRMMKAPGRDCQIPRHVFERDPKGYFRGLHSKQPIEHVF